MPNPYLARALVEQQAVRLAQQAATKKTSASTPPAAKKAAESADSTDNQPSSKE